MKTKIIKSSINVSEYTNLLKYERFVYCDCGFEFFGFKINNGYAILINGSGRFIVAKVYQNDLSIGAKIVIEYKTFEEAEKAIERGVQID